MTPAIWEDDTLGFPAITDTITERERVSGWVVVFIVIAVVAAHLMMPSFADAKIAPAGITVQGKHATSHQREMAYRVLTKCDAMNANRTVLIASMVTTTQESWTSNLKYGHSSSLGLFQILNIHGSVAQRTNPEWSAKWFCSRAINVNYHKPHLTVAQLAQYVQRSGKKCGSNPPAQYKCYQRWTREAVRTYRLTLRRP